MKTVELDIKLKPLKELSDDEVRQLTLIDVNPFRFSSELKEYLRKSQEEFFHRLENRKR
jgi:hypothetical protein